MIARQLQTWTAVTHAHHDVRAVHRMKKLQSPRRCEHVRMAVGGAAASATDDSGCVAPLGTGVAFAVALAAVAEEYVGRRVGRRAVHRACIGVSRQTVAGRVACLWSVERRAAAQRRRGMHAVTRRQSSIVCHERRQGASGGGGRSDVRRAEPAEGTSKGRARGRQGTNAWMALTRQARGERRTRSAVRVESAVWDR